MMNKNSIIAYATIFILFLNHSAFAQDNLTRWLHESGATEVASAGGSVHCYSKASQPNNLLNKDASAEYGIKYPFQDQQKQGYSLLIFQPEKMVYCEVKTSAEQKAPEEGEDTPSAAGGPPMIIDDTGTVDKGHWEVITAMTGQKDFATVLSPTLDVNYGSSENTQIHFLIPWNFQQSPGSTIQSGVGSAEIGLKYRFLGDPDSGFSMLAFPRVSIDPEQHAEVVLPLIIQQRLGKFAVGSQVGIDFKPGEPNQLLYGILAGYNASKRVQILAEVVANSTTDFKENQVSFNMGSRIKINKHVNFIFSAGHSLYRIEHGQFVFYVGLQTSI